MKDRKYKFIHITDLAKLDDKDIEAFQDQLPTLIAELKKAENMGKVLRTDLQYFVPFVDWENDGDDEVETEIRIINR